TAQVEVSPILQPRPHLRRVLENPMLDVDLVVLVAREREIEARQQAVARIPRQLVLEQEIATAPRITKEQPIAAARAERAPLLQKGAERRDPGAGADHDDRHIG